MKTEKLILFDLGGVVLNIDFHRIWQHWSQTSGVDLSNAEVSLGPAAGDNEAFHQFERGQISEAAFYESTARRTGMKMPFEAWRAGWNAIFIGEMPGTQTLLKELSGQARLMALSNINAPHHAYTEEHFSKLLGPFESIVYSHEVNLRKPEKAIFDLIVRRSGVRPENILFFDDMPSNAEGAVQAGLCAEVFENAEQARTSIAKFLKE